MIIRCGNCGAPLDTSARRKHVRCAYCGFPNVVQQAEAIAAKTPKGWQPPAVWTPPLEARAESVPLELKQPPSARRGLAALVIVALLGGAFAFVALAHSEPEAPAEPAATTPSPLRPETVLVLSTSTLPKLTREDGTKPIADSALSGDATRYDPLADFPRLQRIAEQWAVDARLHTITVGQARSDGTVDLNGKGGSALYKFLSPARVAAAKKLREVSNEKPIASQLIMTVHPDTVKAYVRAGRRLARRRQARVHPTLRAGRRDSFVENPRAAAAPRLRHEPRAQRLSVGVGHQPVRRQAAPPHRLGGNLQAQVAGCETCPRCGRHDFVPVVTGNLAGRSSVVPGLSASVWKCGLRCSARSAKSIDT